jgi:hypothetical protein
VSSSSTEPIDSFISEEIIIINPQLQLSRVLTRAHSKEIGQPPIEFTIPERTRQSKKDKESELTFISGLILCVKFQIS